MLDNARLINTATIRRNLETKYAELSDINITIPNFEDIVQQFIEKATYKPNTFITYPLSGKFGINILAEEITTIKASNGIVNNFYSMKAELPEGTSLKIIIKGGMWYHVAIPAPENWTVDRYDDIARKQSFSVTQSGVPNDLSIMADPGEITIEYYENGAEIPTRVKKVKVTETETENWTNKTEDLFEYNKNKVSITEGMWEIGRASCRERV